MTGADLICSNYEVGSVKVSTLHKECKISDDIENSHCHFF